MSSMRPKKKTEIPITEPKKLGSVGREMFFLKFFLLVFYGSCLIEQNQIKNNFHHFNFCLNIER